MRILAVVLGMALTHMAQAQPGVIGGGVPVITEQAIGTVGSAAGTKGKIVAGQDGSSVARIVLTDSTGRVQVAGALVNQATTGSGTTATVSTVKTEAAPANAIGFYLQALDTNTANIRFGVGITASTTVGAQLQPGRSELINLGATISLCAESGTQGYVVQWFAP